MYLVEALKYNVPAFHEDRLTQIVAATFNESIFFQRVFLKFLSVPHQKGLVAKTQVVDERAPSRPDLILFDGTIPFILIESKVGARSDKLQQRKHAHLKAHHNFLISRDPVQQERIDARFRRVTWYEFFTALEHAKNLTQNSLDAFLFGKLINFGRECKMLLPDRISKIELERACSFLTATRLRDSPQQSFNEVSPFQSLEAISLFLDRILIKVKDDIFLGQKIKPFTRRLKLTSLFYPKIRKAISHGRTVEERRELKMKSDLIVLNKEIRLKKIVNGFNFLYVRASFVPYYREAEISSLKPELLRKIGINRIHYRCELSAGFIDNKRESLDFVVFDDSEDIQFTYFYAEVIKCWKKVLGSPE